MSRIDLYVPAVQLFAARLVLFQEVAARQLGLTATELKCFRLVQAGQAATAASLVAETGLTPAALSAIVDRLVEKGFITREQDAADRRRWLLKTVPGSPERAEAVYRDHGERVDAILTRYEPEQFDFLMSFFDEFGNAMRASALTMSATNCPESSETFLSRGSRGREQSGRPAPRRRTSKDGRG